jgi:hypothetical protein
MVMPECQKFAETEVNQYSGETLALNVPAQHSFPVQIATAATSIAAASIAAVTATSSNKHSSSNSYQQQQT